MTLLAPRRARLFRRSAHAAPGRSYRPVRAANPLLHPAAGRPVLAGSARPQPTPARHRAAHRAPHGAPHPGGLAGGSGSGALRRTASLHASRAPLTRSRTTLLASGAAVGVALAGLAANGAFAASPAPTTVHTVASTPLGRWQDPALLVGHTVPTAAVRTVPAAASRSQFRAPLHRITAAVLTPTITDADGATFSGYASWYGPGFNGGRTADGAIFNENGLSAASRTLPLGSYLRVCYQRSCVVVVVNDRGPAPLSRVLDLSEGAAEVIGLLEHGVGYVTATPVAA